MHESTNRQKTWDPHSLSGWYLRMSTEHYRCHKIFCKKTHSEKISDTVFFWHRYITQPMVTPEDQIIKAIGDLSSALRHQVNIRGNEEMAVLQKMNDILNNTTTVLVEKKKNVTFKDPYQNQGWGEVGAICRNHLRLHKLQGWSQPPLTNHYAWFPPVDQQPIPKIPKLWPTLSAEDGQHEANRHLT